MKLFTLVCTAALMASPAFALDAKKSSGEIITCARDSGLIGMNEKNSCFFLVQEGEAVALREKHTPACGGDPAVAPTRALFTERFDTEIDVTPLGYDNGVDGWRSCFIVN